VSLSQELLESFACDNGHSANSYGELLRSVAKEILWLRKQISEFEQQVSDLQEVFDNFWESTAALDLP
jgi:hypothetical protein